MARARSRSYVEPTGRCRDCRRPTYGAAARCRRRRCPGYAPTWARDQRCKLFANLRAFGTRNERVLMLTVTPRGADVLPWDRAWCSSREPHTCSGRHGCRVKPIPASGWNVTAAETLAAPSPTRLPGHDLPLRTRIAGSPSTSLGTAGSRRSPRPSGSWIRNSETARGSGPLPGSH